ncbi:MAG: DNA gyrase subunit A, partial [Phycisphaerales bacterium]
FQDNYDGTTTEPLVLPARFPNLLVNGSTGIAVGMACSIPPHNLGEVLDAAVALIDNPELSLQELLEIIPGPDFPTGGVILGRRGIVEAYATGRGRITVRGEIHVEDIPGSRDRQQIVITSLPYQLTGVSLMEKIADAVNDERIKGVSEARNEADMRNPVRIVCELRKGADPAVVEQQLYQYTPLKQTFSIINIALAGRRPMTLSLREMLQHYIDHRVEVIRRRTAHLLREAQKKAHILEGLIYAVCDIDEVIRIIRGSSTREEAIQALMARKFRIPADHPFAPKIPGRLMRALEKSGGGASLTRVQADAIGAMRLIQLVGLEIERLVNDYTKLVEQIEDYEDILANQPRVYAMIKQDCADMKAKFGTPRRTTIEEYEGDIDIADLIEQKDVVVTISHEGYVKRVPLETYRQQGRGGVGIIASDSKDEDFIEHVFVASTHDDLLAFTDTGRVFKLKVYELPEMSRQSKGRALVN